MGGLYRNRHSSSSELFSFACSYSHSAYQTISWRFSGLFSGSRPWSSLSSRLDYPTRYSYSPLVYVSRGSWILLKSRCNSNSQQSSGLQLHLSHILCVSNGWTTRCTPTGAHKKKKVSFSNWKSCLIKWVTLDLKYPINLSLYLERPME